MHPVGVVVRRLADLREPQLAVERVARDLLGLLPHVGLGHHVADAVAGEGELAGVVPVRVLIDDAADVVRIEAGEHPVHHHLRDRDLAALRSRRGTRSKPHWRGTSRPWRVPWYRGRAARPASSAACRRRSPRPSARWSRRAGSDTAGHTPPAAESRVASSARLRRRDQRRTLDVRVGARGDHDELFVRGHGSMPVRLSDRIVAEIKMRRRTAGLASSSGSAAESSSGGVSTGIDKSWTEGSSDGSTGLSEAMGAVVGAARQRRNKALQSGLGASEISGFGFPGRADPREAAGSGARISSGRGNETVFTRPGVRSRVPGSVPAPVAAAPPGGRPSACG